MELIHGKQTSRIEAACLAARIAGHEQVLIDLGAGDGRYVLTMARRHPGQFAVGIDACRENLHRISRVAPPNALFLIGNALDLPPELESVATRITINFPWGSLLQGLLDTELGLIRRLRLLARPEAALEVRLNAGALSALGWPLHEGATQIRLLLREEGFLVGSAVELDAVALRRFPSSWSKRLAFGRDPSGLLLSGLLPVDDCVRRQESAA